MFLKSFMFDEYLFNVFAFLGYKWKDDNTKDFYDHRRRGW